MRLCTEPGCGYKRYAHGLCLMHYRRWKRNGTTELLTRQERSRAARVGGLASEVARRQNGVPMPKGPGSGFTMDGSCRLVVLLAYIVNAQLGVHLLTMRAGRPL